MNETTILLQPLWCFLALLKITLVYAHIHIYCYYENLCLYLSNCLSIVLTFSASTCRVLGMPSNAGQAPGTTST